MGKPSKFSSLKCDRRISTFGQRTFTTAFVYAWDAGDSVCHVALNYVFFLLMSSSWRLVSECTPVEPPLLLPTTNERKKGKIQLMTACHCSCLCFFC